MAFALSASAQSAEQQPLRAFSRAGFASWIGSEDAPPVPLNHVGVVHAVLLSPEEIGLARTGSAQGEIPLGDEIATNVRSFDPGLAAPLVAGETLSVVMACPECDAQFERTIGDFVDEVTPVFVDASEVQVVNDSRTGGHRIDLRVTVDDDTSPSIVAVLEDEAGGRQLLDANVVTDAEQSIGIGLAPSVNGTFCFQLVAIDWAGHESDPTQRSCTDLGGCNASGASAPLVVALFAAVRGARSHRRGIVNASRR